MHVHVEVQHPGSGKSSNAISHYRTSKIVARPAGAIVPDGASVAYPPLTKDMHHEVELVVALKSGGRNIPLSKALDCIYGYGVGIDLTRRDLQIASRDMKRPWEIGKAFDASAPCGPLQPTSKIGHPSKGRIALTANGEVRQDGDLAQMIRNRPEIIVKLPAMVRNGADTTAGASTSEGSSNMTSSGAPMRQRPIASICCAPPESVPAGCAKRSASTGNKPNTRCRFAVCAPRARGSIAPTSRFSATDSVGNTWRPSATWPMPRL